MNGVYDLDGDQMLEFIALELNPKENVFPNKVRYYEIDADSYQTLIWEFKPPVELAGDFVDAKIGDVDGDGSPEIVIVMNLSRFENNTTPHVFLATYSWTGTNFSEIPSYTLDLGKENRSLRCNNFKLFDQDSDGDQEIVLALGSPFRGFAVVNVNANGMSLSKKIRPDQLLVGSGLLYVGVVDYDGDGYAQGYFHLTHTGSSRAFDVDQQSTQDSDWVKVTSTGSNGTVCINQDDQGTSVGC